MTASLPRGYALSDKVVGYRSLISVFATFVLSWVMILAWVPFGEVLGIQSGPVLALRKPVIEVLSE